MRWFLAAAALAIGGCQAVDPMDAEAADMLAEGAKYQAKVRAMGTDPSGGKIFDEGGRTPFTFGRWTIRCATVKIDPAELDPVRPKPRRAILAGNDVHLESPMQGRWFDHLWTKAGC